MTHGQWFLDTCLYTIHAFRCKLHHHHFTNKNNSFYQLHFHSAHPSIVMKIALAPAGARAREIDRVNWASDNHVYCSVELKMLLWWLVDSILARKHAAK